MILQVFITIKSILLMKIIGSVVLVRLITIALNSESYITDILDIDKYIREFSIALGIIIIF